MTTTLMTQALQSVALPKILRGQDLHVNSDNKYNEDDKLVKRTDSSLKNANMFQYVCTLYIMAITDPQG